MRLRPGSAKISSIATASVAVCQREGQLWQARRAQTSRFDAGGKLCLEYRRPRPYFPSATATGQLARVRLLRRQFKVTLAWLQHRSSTNSNGAGRQWKAPQIIIHADTENRSSIRDIGWQKWGNAVEDNTHQVGLPPYASLGKDSAQVCTSGITAHP